MDEGTDRPPHFHTTEQAADYARGENIGDGGEIEPLNTNWESKHIWENGSPRPRRSEEGREGGSRPTGDMAMRVAFNWAFEFVERLSIPAGFDCGRVYVSDTPSLRAVLTVSEIWWCILKLGAMDDLIQVARAYSNWCTRLTQQFCSLSGHVTNTPIPLSGSFVAYDTLLGELDDWHINSFLLATAVQPTTHGSAGSEDSGRSHARIPSAVSGSTEPSSSNIEPAPFIRMLKLAGTNTSLSMLCARAAPGTRHAACPVETFLMDTASISDLAALRRSTYAKQREFGLD
ncbi:hypothetical protein B0H16DRAFT_1699294 [Mycena metata]|uniref:Uncharacterized protein n=1 Tax=Mycena metata TaxID=1033252 RepID=A0AAD7HJT8_9AGAR|nr:hypothetical protein B0H16DRAFT_1699294 [Mycena metata]